MNFNLEEGIYQAGTVFLFVAAFALFLNMLNIQLNLLDYSHEYTRFNDQSQVQQYGGEIDEDSQTGAQIIAAIININAIDYQVNIEGESYKKAAGADSADLYEMGSEFENMDIRKIDSSKDYKLIINRTQNTGEIQSINYYD